MSAGDDALTGAGPKEGSNGVDAAKGSPSAKSEGSQDVKGADHEKASDSVPNELERTETVALDEEEARQGAAATEEAKAQDKSKQSSLEELRSAFPSVDEKVIKAVLIASQGVLPPAFEALLFLSDPSFEGEAAVPTEPLPEMPVARKLSQIEQDEQLARQLDERFNKGLRDESEHELRSRRRVMREREPSFRQQHADLRQRLPPQRDAHDDESDDSDFIDSLNRGIQETSKKVSQWWDGVKKTWADEHDTVSTNPPRSRQRRFNSFGARDGDEQGYPDEYRSSQGPIFQYYDSNIEDSPPPMPVRPHQDDTTRAPPPPKLASAKPNPSKQASSRKKDPDQDAFLINSDDEL